MFSYDLLGDVQDGRTELPAEDFKTGVVNLAPETKHWYANAAVRRGSKAVFAFMPVIQDLQYIRFSGQLIVASSGPAQGRYCPHVNGIKRIPMARLRRHVRTSEQLLKIIEVCKTCT